MSPERREWYEHGDQTLYGYTMLDLANADLESLKESYRRFDAEVRDRFASRLDDLVTVDVTDAASRPLSKLVTALEGWGLLGLPGTNQNAGPYLAAHQVGDEG